MPGTLYIGSDKRVNLTSLEGDGVALTTATVTWSLTDMSGEVIGTGSLTLSSGSTYTGVIESTVTDQLEANTDYLLDVTIVQGAYNDFRRVVCGAAYRAET